ncbi:MAG TPA: site-2 protease family protein [Candidatus Nanoarchaeia archaeon]|nr:site-2 protease family protein [Candidatus Nanoarchaeia archaeon]
MDFIVYDIILLILFAIFLSSFLYVGRKNLKREGLLLLYKTSWGIKLIENIGKKYKKTIKALSYVSISLGYVLMASMIYFLYQIVKVYIFRPDVVSAVKVPPLIPLVPYLPQVFKLDFLPPFYFTYWIIIIAVIAITHEFSHGIFASFSNIKIKKTGFGFFPFFLPIFLAAFVELDEERMAKKPKFIQLAVLSAGTFANVLTAIIFFVIFWAFFSLAFVPAGVVFDAYPYTTLDVSTVMSVNGIQLSDPSIEKIIELTKEDELNKIVADGKVFVSTKNSLEKQLAIDGNKINLYYDSPAINSRIIGAIIEINGVKTNSMDKFKEEILKYSPGDKIKIKTDAGDEGGILEYEIVLGDNPEDPGKPWIGIAFFERSGKGISGKISELVSSFREPHIYYKPKFGELGLFIYHLLWWIILISISVALVNMLPVGIFDGGKFFYLTIWGITKSEKKAKKAFAFMTYLFLLIVIVLMVFWAINFR